jgi:hypothetical protein
LDSAELYSDIPFGRLEGTIWGTCSNGVGVRINQVYVTRLDDEMDVALKQVIILTFKDKSKIIITVLPAGLSPLQDIRPGDDEQQKK